MKLSEIYAVANEIAPKRLSDEYCKTYGAYDNSGVLVDTGKDVKKILFSLDLSKAAVAKAVEIGADLIITHHPAIYGKIGRICANDPLGGKLISCIEKGISVLSMHLNLDAAKGGTDESLMQGVQAASGFVGEGNGSMPMLALTDGGYGRVYDIQPLTAGELAKNMQGKFCSDKILVYGKDKQLKKVASFCGAGGDEAAISFALSNGADGIISSDFKHHVVAAAVESGLSVIILTHYASENYGFKKYYEKICQQIAIPCEYHEDKDLL